MPLEAKGEINAIQRENARAGTSAWRLTSPALKREIEGYASLTSVIRGQDVSGSISTLRIVPTASRLPNGLVSVAMAQRRCMVL